MEELKEGVIYSIENLNDSKIYVGSTFNKKLENRLAVHKSMKTNSKCACAYFFNCDEPNIIMKELARVNVKDRKELNEIENEYIRTQDPNLCVNKNNKMTKEEKHERILTSLRKTRSNYTPEQKENIKKYHKEYYNGEKKDKIKKLILDAQFKRRKLKMLDKLNAKERALTPKIKQRYGIIEKDGFFVVEME